MRLRPSNIYYSQDSISPYFDRRSDHDGVRLGETLDDLVDGSCDIEDIPTIEVVKMHGKWFTVDNRRLWVFRRLERLGLCRKIPVIVGDDIPDEKFTTENGGKHIEVRGNPGGSNPVDSSDSDTGSSDSDDDLFDRLGGLKLK